MTPHLKLSWFASCFEEAICHVAVLNDKRKAFLLQKPIMNSFLKHLKMLDQGHLRRSL